MHPCPAALRSVFGGAYKGGRLICISTGDGPEFASGTYKNTPSTYNPGQAELALKIINLLLASAAERGGPNQMTASDILLLTAYRGQLSELLSKRREHLGNARGNALDALTITQAEGQERNIVALSLTAHNPEYPLSLRMAGEWRFLNVAITRAKRYCIIFGHFHGMCRELLGARQTEKYGHVLNKPSLSHIKSLLAHLWDRDLIIGYPEVQAALDGAPKSTPNTFRSRVTESADSLIPRPYIAVPRNESSVFAAPIMDREMTQQNLERTRDDGDEDDDGEEEARKRVDDGMDKTQTSIRGRGGYRGRGRGTGRRGG